MAFFYVLYSIGDICPQVNAMESFKPQTLEESIYATVAYFDIFDYPLTPHELWIYLLYPPVESDNYSIEDVFEKSAHIPGLEWVNGLLCLKGRSECVQMRIDRYLIAERKIQKALAYARVCAFIPGISMIALCNTLAFSNSRDGSDIDFFVAVKKGYLWFVRASFIVISLFFGKRISDRHTRDALCLSFFACENELDFSKLALADSDGVGDVYLAVWASRCIPLYDERGTYELFWNSNAWTEAIVPNRIRYIPNHMRRIRLSMPFLVLKKSIAVLFSLFHVPLECVCRAIQRRKFPSDIRLAAEVTGSGVVISDSMLKFHLNDRRTVFREMLCENIRSYQKNNI